MLMIILIILLLTAIAMYKFIMCFNSYTSAHAHYEFFTMDHSLAMVFSYALIFFGYHWLQNGNDELNGAIVMGIGILILLWIMINNFIKAPRYFAIIGSLLQLIFYIPIAIGAVIIVFVMMAWVSQTKPVYVINND